MIHSVKNYPILQVSSQEHSASSRYDFKDGGVLEIHKLRVESLCTDPYMSYMSNLALILLARSHEFQAQKDYKLRIYSGYDNLVKKLISTWGIDICLSWEQPSCNLDKTYVGRGYAYIPKIRCPDHLNKLL